MKEFGFNDHDFHAIARRAYELSLQGAYEPAATLLEGLRAIDPLDRYSLMTLAAVRLKQGRGADAATLLEGWLSARPDDAEPRELLIEALLDAERWAEARAEHNRLQAAGAGLPRRLSLRLQAAENYS